MTTYRQLLVGASAEDAITGMARRLDAALRAVGTSEIYARHVTADVLGSVRHHTELGRARPGDVLIYHASYGDPEVTRLLLQRSEPIVLVYHNVTPSEHFLPFDPPFAAGLEWGRRELALIRPRVVRAVADSSFNADDLRQYGYDDVSVLPVGLDPYRLHHVAPDGVLAAELRQQFPDGFVLWVSQLLPHKRVELALAATSLLRWVHQRDLGIVIAGFGRIRPYADAARAYARILNVQKVRFTGVVPDAALRTLFARASVFLTTSAHEGLGLPVSEAMAAGIPVIAAGAGALPETIGDAGVVLPVDAGPMLYAEAMAEVLSNEGLRCEMVRRGFRRADQLRASGSVDRFVPLLQELG